MWPKTKCGYFCTWTKGFWGNVANATKDQVRILFCTCTTGFWGNVTDRHLLSWRKSPDLRATTTTSGKSVRIVEPISLNILHKKSQLFWVGYLSTTNVPVEDCGNVVLLLGLTSSSRPASVEMFDVKLSCSERWRFYSCCVIHIEWVVLLLELLGPDQVGVSFLILGLGFGLGWWLISFFLRVWFCGCN